MTRYIFITGGVCSSLGKGVTTAALGCLLEGYGYRVTLLKMDPYINVDPGTISPFQHGEVFVTDDGAETDLDLGYYERFTSNLKLSRKNSVSAGQIYHAVIERERRGGYLGRTVQVVPHITNEIKFRIEMLHRDVLPELDFVIVEIGGTVGDIESIPFLEAIRQLHWESPKSVCFIHLTLNPTIDVSGEIKTKPTQHSVKELLSFGIQTDILVCRVRKPLKREMKEKMALFCNVNYKNIISAADISSSIYEIPVMYHREKLDEVVMNHFDLSEKKFEFGAWGKMVERIRSPRSKVKIAICGKYVSLKDAYRSVYEAILHGGVSHQVEVEMTLIDSEKSDTENLSENLGQIDGLLVPGGFGDRGIEGKIKAIQFARENKIPFFGICLGMQCAIIEYARHVLNLENANSTEFEKDTTNPVISLLEEQLAVKNKGATMRLGSYPCMIQKSTLLHTAYQKDHVAERHRHRYEFTMEYKEPLEKAGMVFSGLNPSLELVEAIELSIEEHPWFVGVQFHPEFRSKPTLVHPLFSDFIGAAIDRIATRNGARKMASDEQSAIYKNSQANSDYALNREKILANKLSIGNNSIQTAHGREQEKI